MDFERQNQFFDKAVPFENKIVSEFTKPTRYNYKIPSDIIENLLSKYNARCNYQQSKFMRGLNQRSEDAFMLIVPNPTHFDLTIRLISSDISFRQAALST